MKKLPSFLQPKKWLLFFLSCLFCIGFLELLSPVIYTWRFSKPFDRAGILQSLQAVSENKESANNELVTPQLNFNEDMVLHPYLGYVYNEGKYINRYGFIGTESLPKRAPGRMIIGITSGSVAAGLSTEMYAAKALGQLPDFFPGKEIEIVSFALPGYKQPQQLLALNFLLTLGAEFDIIINLDGYNEIALPYKENIPAQIHPAFPRYRANRSSQALSCLMLIRTISGKSLFPSGSRHRYKWGGYVRQTILLTIIVCSQTNIYPVPND